MAKTSVYRLGKLRSKYIIIETWSYAKFLKEMLKNMWKANKSIRSLILNNVALIYKIIFKRETVEV